MIYTISCEVGNSSSIAECLAYFRDKEEIQVDTETNGRDPHTHKIISLQLGDSENQWFIDCRKVDVLNFKDLLEGKVCIMQNSKFDYKMLKKAGIYIEKIYDTMLAECVIACGYEKWGYSLDALVKRYLGIEMSKETRNTFIGMHDSTPFTLEQVIYGCLDVTYLQRIKDSQKALISKYNLEYCVNLENQVVKALGDIEYNGMYLDQLEWLRITEKQKDKLAYLEGQLDEIIEKEPVLKSFTLPGVQGNIFGGLERAVSVNYASPVQIKQICHSLGFYVESTSDRELSKLANKHIFFKVLKEYRKSAKIISTYGESFLDYVNPSTGKVHTDFWQIKDTGRVSSGSKDMNAPNVQNIPGVSEKVVLSNGKTVVRYPFRNCFKARPGFKWVSIDYSGQELRLMADASGEQGFIDVLNRGEDLHCYVGEMMFKRPIDKEKDKELRHKAKTINFGKPYGMGPDKLSDTLEISKEEAEELFSMYAREFPTLNAWLDRKGREAINQGYSLTFSPCQRRRWYPDAHIAKKLRAEAKKGDKEAWRQILTIEGQISRNGGNSPIQGTGADITKEALVEVRELITFYNNFYKEEVAYLICTVHDAIDCEVREDLAEEFAKKMADIMIKCGNKYVSKVKMEVDVTITQHWTK